MVGGGQMVGGAQIGHFLGGSQVLNGGQVDIEGHFGNFPINDKQNVLN